MRVLWKVRSWSKDRDFFDRDLEVRTEDLAPVDHNLIEYVVSECRESHRLVRAVLIFGRLSAQMPVPKDPFSERWLCVPEYFEAPDGTELSLTRIAHEKFNNPNLVAVPYGFQQHDIDLMFEDSKVPPNPHLAIRLSQAELDAIAYFVRDASELSESASVEGNHRP